MSPYDPNAMRPEWLIPGGVFIVTLGSEDRPNAYAAGWVVRVSEVPVMIQVAVWQKNYSYGLAPETDNFVLQILEDGQQEVARHFGQQSGRDIDKLGRYPTHIGRSGLPVLDDCLAYLECHVVFRRVFGDHIILVGDVIHSAINRQGDALIHDYADYHTNL